MPARGLPSTLAPALLLLAGLTDLWAAAGVAAGPGLRWQEGVSMPQPNAMPQPAAPLPPGGLQWRELPGGRPGLNFSPIQGGPGEGAAASEPAAAPQAAPATATLLWGPVPDDEVISLADAAGSTPPELPYLPEPPLPRWPEVRALARGITVNGEAYPDTGMKVPNGFAGDPEYTMSTSLVGTSRTRSCRVPRNGSWRDCADAETYLDLIPFRWDGGSFGLQWTVQSLSSRNRGTAQLAGQSLGFRTAFNLTPSTGLAFGGEHVLQLDDVTDLGRNFYLVLSQAIPLSDPGPDQILAVATVGIGSDLYGYGSNGSLGSTDCLSGNNISSRTYPEGTECYWGAIGSLSVQFGSQISAGLEWFGYGIGAGVSLRPLRNVPLTLSFYLTDFLGNVPSGIEELCTSDPCEPRLYGRITMSF